MGVPRKGPCQQWVTPDDLTGCRLPDGVTDEAKLLACEFASRMLYKLSGRKYSGACVDEEHPAVGFTCGPWHDGRFGLWGRDSGFPMFPFHSEGGWSNLVGWSPAQQVSSIWLAGPVTSVDEVWVNGVQLTAEVDYKIAGFAELCRLPVGTYWPVDADPTVDKDQPGSFYVKWHRGQPIDDICTAMAKLYAVAKIVPLICSSGGCGSAFLDGAAHVSADGVSVDSIEALLLQSAQGRSRTGVPIVDAWLDMENPTGRRGRRRSYRADMPERKTRHWTGTAPTP